MATIVGWPKGTPVDETYTRAYGVQQAIDWVDGCQPSPAGVEDQPVTPLAAAREAERVAVWANRADAAGSLSPLDVQWAIATSCTLLWLLGESDEAPLRLPFRSVDGGPATAEELFALVARRPGRSLTEDELCGVREWSVQEAQHSLELAWRIELTRRRLRAEITGVQPQQVQSGPGPAH